MDGLLVEFHRISQLYPWWVSKRWEMAAKLLGISFRKQANYTL